MLPFLKAPADEVVDKALVYVFAKDRDFQDFLRTERGRSGCEEFAHSAHASFCVLSEPHPPAIEAQQVSGRE